MKPLFLAGILLTIIGAFVLTSRGGLMPHHNGVRVGDLEVMVQEQRAIPTWVGIAVVITGALMVGAGLRGRKAR